MRTEAKKPTRKLKFAVYYRSIWAGSCSPSRMQVALEYFKKFKKKKQKVHFLISFRFFANFYLKNKW